MNREVKNQVDHSLSNRERVVVALQAYGTQEVHVSVDTLAGATGLKPLQVYQALYGMQKEGRVEILTEPISNTGRKKVSGVVLKKVPSAESILESVPERIERAAIAPKSMKRAELKVREAVPTIIAYMDKKLVIDKICQELRDAGIDPDITVNFETNSLAEEGMILLNEWVAVQRAYNDMAVRNEALEREIQTLKGLKQPIPELSGDARMEALEGMRDPVLA